MEDVKMRQAHWQFRLVSSLEKVFADEGPRALNHAIPQSVFVGETLSFQIAFRPPGNAEKMDSLVRFEVGGPLASVAAVSSVELVPCEFVAFPDHDEGYSRSAPGLYPDLLRPRPDGVVAPVVGGWRAAWFDVMTDDLALAGEHEIRVRAFHEVTGDLLHEERLSVRVIGARLPALDIVNTHWFHADGIAEYYGIEVFSEEHWQAIDNAVASAARMQANSLLVPVWTPPIDTAIGARRLRVQLVDIVQDAEGYQFDFDRLGRWLAMLERHGIAYLELPHLFTQWGAKATPAIYAEVAGEQRQVFGWDVAATDPAYTRFLEQFLPALQQYLAGRWDSSKIIYHLSDEPGPEDQAAYQAARDSVEHLLDGCTVVDALSDFAYFERGIVPHPVVATDHVEPFLEARIEPLWVYFCVAQHRAVANRFIGMPLSRLRVLGHQLFWAEAAGFLHWGFNFYHSASSRGFVNPFADTSAAGTLPAGDPFIVYPGPDLVVWESIRHRTAAQAMWDHRALRELGARRGREAALAVIDPQGSLSFSSYPLDPDHYLAVRERINEQLEELLID